jgi:gluconate 2-dehydrogenase alpha chain
LPAVAAAIVGGGWTGSIIGKELAAAGQRVVMLERGEARWTMPDYQAPQVHDELKYTRRHHTHRNTAQETYTFRNNVDQVALPMRRWQFAFPAKHLGGAGVHWSGAYYRYDVNEFKLRSHYTQRYGAGIWEAGITAQDWPVSYDDLEPYYDRFEYLIGASGKAGNIKGVLQSGGSPFDAPHSRDYPNPPCGCRMLLACSAKPRLRSVTTPTSSHQPCALAHT